MIRFPTHRTSLPQQELAGIPLFILWITSFLFFLLSAICPTSCIFSSYRRALLIPAIGYNPYITLPPKSYYYACMLRARLFCLLVPEPFLLLFFLLFFFIYRHHTLLCALMFNVSLVYRFCSHHWSGVAYLTRYSTNANLSYN